MLVLPTYLPLDGLFFFSRHRTSLCHSRNRESRELALAPVLESFCHFLKAQPIFLEEAPAAILAKDEEHTVTRRRLLEEYQHQEQADL
jgi:hypothetical protein